MQRLFVFFILTIATISLASWQKVAQLDGRPTCCFFMNDLVGLAGSGDYNSSDILKIWRTNDGGSTWLPCNVPLGSGQVTSIFMKDDQIGYASIFSQGNPNQSLWKTTDGGYSWVDFSKTDNGYTIGVWVTPKALIKTKWSGAPGGSAPGGSSIDGGNTFSSRFYKGSYENSNGIYFTSDSVGVATAGPMTGVSWYTTNGGMSWTEGSAQAEAWSAWGFQGTNIFFAVAELQRELLWSTNGGRTWARRFGFGPLLANNIITTGHISGKAQVMYVQTYGAGMLRTGSNDTGATWRLVGGPSNIVDSRAFYVGGCSGEYVIAFEHDGSVWRTNDGGDGTLGGTQPLTLEHINFPSITACTSSTKFGVLAFGDCGEFVVSAASIENDPSGVFALRPLTLPDTLPTGGVDTFYVDFDPRGNPATYSARLRIRGVLHRAGSFRNVDTIIRISASATAVAPRLSASLNSVSFGGVSVCGEELDTTITLRNEGCDTLTITSGPTATAVPFTVQSLPLPLDLPPDSTVTFNISFKPVSGGAFTSATKLQAVSQGKQQEVEILLDGSGIEGQGLLSVLTPTLSFGAISICLTDSLEAAIANTGCDTLVLDSASLAGDADFSLLTDPFTIGLKLRPRDTLRFKVLLTPLQKGARRSMFSFALRNEHGTFPESIAQVVFTANVVDGTKSIAQSLTAIDFGSTDLCTERDTIFSLRNTGCDTIEVSSVDIQGQGFDLPGLVLPIRLPPGKSVDIGLRTKADTAGGQTQSVAIVRVVGSATNLVTPIQLKRGYIFPRSFSVGLAVRSTEETAGGILRLAIIGEQGLGAPGSGIRSLEATVDLNTDLLHYLRAEGPNTVVSNGSQVSITNTAELQSMADNTLAELVYEVYLTKDSATDISLSNLKLNNGSASGCAATVLASSASMFTYRYECGQRAIRQFLRSGALPLKIISVHPNPALDEIRIDIASPGKGSMKVEVYNALGQLMEHCTLEAAPHITLNVRGYEDGNYTLRLVQDAGSASCRFIVRK